MPKAHKPRSGSMQFWPRSRAKRAYATVKSWPKSNEAKLLGFAGYKVGMTHAIITNNTPNSLTKGENISIPVTIIECPPIKISSIRFYKKSQNKLIISQEIKLKTDKELDRKIPKLKKQKDEELKKIEQNIDSFYDVRVAVYTQPKLTGIGKKKPEVFEIALGGSSPKEKLTKIKEIMGKEISVSDVFQEGNQIDIKSITTGRGFQGPVKRFGVGIRHHKSEKTKRGPGSLGGWKGQAHFMYRIAHAGQMGFHQRTEQNKWIIKISDKPEEIKVKGGFPRYGEVKNTYIIIKGSLPGPRKRLIRFNQPAHPNKKVPKEAPSIEHISLESKQGN